VLEIARDAGSPPVKKPVKESPVEIFNSLFKSSGDFSKLIKVVQYCCVCISEFNLMRIAIRLYKKRIATKEEVLTWFKRFKVMGSALSTSRMALRLCGGIENLNFFLKQIRNYLQKKKLDSTFNIVNKAFYFWSAFFDNWYYLTRIGTLKFSSPEQGVRVSRAGTGCTIVSYTMELLKEFYDAKTKS